MFNEKRATIITCIVGIIISGVLPLLLFGKEFNVVRHDSLFFMVWVLLSTISVVGCVITIVKAEDPSVSNFVKMIPIITMALLAIWSFGWCADQRSRASENIKGEISYKIP